MNFEKAKEEIAKFLSICVNTKNLMVLILASSVYMMANGLLRYILPVYFRERGISLVGLGFIYSLARLALAVLQPTVGWLSDRIGRRKIIISAYFFPSLLFPAYMFVKESLVLGIVHSARTAIEQSGIPALDAMMGDVAPQDGRATVVSAYGSLTAFTFASGSLLSHLILRFGLGYKGLFYIASALYLLASSVLFFKLEESIVRDKVRKKPKNFLDKLRIFGEIVRQRSLGGLFLYHFCFSFSLLVFPIYFPLLVREKLKVGVEIVPLLGLVGWMVYALVQPFGGRVSDRLGKRRPWIVAGLLLAAISQTAMGVSNSLATLLVFLVLLEVAGGFFRPVASALAIDIVPAGERGKYFGAMGAIGVIAGTFAPLVYAFLAEYDIGFAFVLSSISYLLAVIAILVLVKEPEYESYR